MSGSVPARLNPLAMWLLLALFPALAAATDLPWLGALFPQNSILLRTPGNWACWDFSEMSPTCPSASSVMVMISGYAIPEGKRQKAYTGVSLETCSKYCVENKV